MKTTGTLILVLALGACAAPPTLKELEFQALRTGDWNAVERRERAMARRAEQQVPSCGTGQVQYCESSFGQQSCQCVSRQAVVDYFDWD